MEEKRTGLIRVVIVGGGMAGASLAKQLDKNKNIEVILIEKNEKYVHYIGALRAFVEPAFAKKMLLPYDRLLKRGRFIQGVVTEITPKQVIYKTSESNTEHMDFDKLIIATGSIFKYPVNVRGDLNEAKINEVNSHIKQAQKILIVGAGPVGVEMAGEIATEFPSKDVTLVSSSSYLGAQFFAPKTQQRITTQLQALGVKIILNDRVELDNSETQVKRTTYTTKNGLNIEADLIIQAVGGKPNNTAVIKNFAAFLDSEGRVKVNDYLQVESFDNIYAVGDINNTKELKTSIAANNQSKYLLSVIQASIVKKPFKTYKPANPAMAVSIGRRGGAGEFAGMKLGKFLISKMKSQNLFVGLAAKGMIQ